MIVCPSCGANLKFNPKSQKLMCDFCGSEFDPHQFDSDKDAQETQINTQEYGSSTDETPEVKDDTYKITVFTCPQCGGELASVDENTAATFCSFCGASTILHSRIAKSKRPEYIIPFSITKEDCKEAYSRVVKKALFLPKEYRSVEYIDGFRGIYMPYWSYDVEQNGNVNLKGERSHRSGDYIITDHYALTGKIDAFYEGLSYDASSSFSDNISEALKPFDVTKRIPFQPSYMSGYYADLPDVASSLYAEDAAGMAYDRSVERIKKETAEFHKYSIAEDKIENRPNAPGRAFSSKTVKAHSSMYPVWFLSYRNGDRVTYATVNGQTGKVAADLPIDVKKYLIGSGIIAVVIFMLLNMFLVLTPKVVLALAATLTLLVFIINAIQRSSIKKAESGEDDRGLMHARNKERLKNKKRNADNTGSDELPKPPEVPEATMTGAEKIILWTGIAILAVNVLVAFFIQPVSDIPYYLLCIVDAVVFCFSFRFTLINYNLMATRRLPQFDRKGGDDRA